MPQLHVAPVQIVARRLAPDQNFARYERQARAAAILGVQVLLGAETCLHAYDLSPENLALAEPLGGPLTARLERLAHELDMILMAGFLERDGEQIYNAHAIAAPGQDLRVQRKHALTPKEMDAGLSQGPRERLVLDFHGVRCAIIICADSGIVGLADDLRAAHIQYRFCPTAGGDILNGKKHRYLDEADMHLPEAQKWYLDHRHTTFLPQAIVDPGGYSCGFTSANALGFDGGGVTHQGHCIIVDNHFIMRGQIPGTTIREHQQDQFCHARLSF